MRALAHPTRVAIIDLLGKHGALTATECGNALGLSAKTCSYHLQNLAAAGLVIEEQGAGRNRPWRLAGSPPVADTPNPLRWARDRKLEARSRRETDILGHAVSALAAAGGDPAWSDATVVHDRVAVLSAAELRAWGEDVERVTSRHLRRAAQSIELGEDTARYPVRLLFYGFPERSAGAAGGDA